MKMQRLRGTEKYPDCFGFFNKLGYKQLECSNTDTANKIYAAIKDYADIKDIPQSLKLKLVCFMV